MYKKKDIFLVMLLNCQYVKSTLKNIERHVPFKTITFQYTRKTHLMHENIVD